MFRQSEICILFIILFIILFAFFAACSKDEAAPGSQEMPGMQEMLPGSQDEEALVVSFVCVGDNLIHEQIWRRREKNADGRYSFGDLYKPVKALVSAADIAFVNQETVCGGEALTLADWPRFNSPQEILDALKETGFNWVSTANNHALDRGDEGVSAQLDYLSKMEGVVQTGTHATRDDSEESRILLVNGVRVGLASYTYGTNGIAAPVGKE